ncbi:bifunctional tRNA (5-methylaminomethyl-2-thiouridine)(34)-methyltransferase MnmD/FAD-dependent 5-carboxymethylaminomethyl-2-thiouridine(34) oxidoreductase MnmC [Marinobacter arenosus]|uniref:bifunctional tRNA (5-methylaminomethyl-2-thiouridine)(34)-methyltransferase MnmD/FAD-dependent 5-carboxymethylaminomethyl-2-thiouridine(34) oxidoreductase MnmC n=1 Tax=Marinobacter arenosus TaxID=2856822 RepID=UPI001C4C5801|nr:bifunctional tRNA (5-methylaminomethyl-2-thiouridine)(34)-methyltransferase MnmD/FAD-dependent 5-carboxymethylaminomethyl-2-thiouridine(34) oxidoreductase MnmC [Marinobacter arenosus]MBW0146058.1 bifunctional tRNA (5-methylaminomethyl-2-thiouridine)(34)-methyltransferase MnmD/FAD-dependent 5-carboxymethylaminomethyl-2-thiouridine(34) oxidoreductase MnmC [Marinobacter arenosus]
MTSDLLPPAIEPAELIWRDGVPESATFGDVYFSRDNGLEETRYVFLAHNGLPDRFNTVPEGGCFVIAESGFGTGLNFLAAWHAWRETEPDHPATLHFISVERFPLTRDDLCTALESWPELSPLASQLVEHYPPLTRGVHRLLFDSGRVRLTLYFGDILDAWQALDFRADAWFLDGFAPSTNPEMWLDQAMTDIRAHSKPGTTLATFTSVGRIRRALASTGFQMEKVRGYGRKRDMLVGRLPTGEDAEEPATLGSVAIIGAGIAGCLLARNLAERGVNVTLVDSSPGAGSGASGNRQGATYVKLGVEFNDQTELALSALMFSQRCYGPYRESCWHPTGLLQLAWNEQEQDRQQRFLARNKYPTEILYPVDRERASQLTGVPTQTGGLWFPGSGWLEPSKLCTQLIQHPGIQTAFNVNVTKLDFSAGKWHLSSSTGTDIVAERVVVCAGHLSPDLLPFPGSFRFKSIRGQVSHLEESSVQAPKAVICGPRYLNPVHEGVAVTGATFDLRDDNPEPTQASNEQNLSELQTMLPDILTRQPGASAPTGATQGRVGFRCTTHDYQPVADQLCDGEGNSVAGMYLFTGLGSKGLSYAPLLAEYLADRLSDQPQCLSAQLKRRLESRRIHRAQGGESS